MLEVLTALTDHSSYAAVKAQREREDRAAAQRDKEAQMVRRDVNLMWCLQRGACRCRCASLYSRCITPTHSMKWPSPSAVPSPSLGCPPWTARAARSHSARLPATPQRPRRRSRQRPPWTRPQRPTLGR